MQDFDLSMQRGPKHVSCTNVHAPGQEVAGSGREIFQKLAYNSLIMRRAMSSISRLIASVLLMTVVTSAIAMAMYICPKVTAPAMTNMMEGMPCAEMDSEKPVHCAQFLTSDNLALEHLAGAPSVTPPAFLIVMPSMAPAIPPFNIVFWPDAPSDPGSDPPYLRTQRLRI